MSIKRVTIWIAQEKAMLTNGIRITVTRNHMETYLVLHSSAERMLPRKERVAIA